MDVQVVLKNDALLKEKHDDEKCQCSVGTML